MRSAFLTAFVLAGVVSAQEQQYDTRTWDVRYLTGTVRTAAAPDLEWPDGSALGVGNGGDEFRLLDPEKLETLLRCCVDPDSWDGGEASIAYDNGRLQVRQEPATLDRVGAFLDGLSRQLSRRIAVDAEVWELQPGVLEAAGAEAGPLAPATEQALRAAAAAPGQGKRIAVLRAATQSGLRTHASDVREANLLTDYDIEIAQDAVVADPVLYVVRDGCSLDVLPVATPDPNLLLLQTRFTAALPAGGRVFEGGTAPEGRLPQPVRRRLRTRGTFACTPGRTLLLTAGGDENTASGTVLAVLLRASRLDEPAPDLAWGTAGHQLRLLDLRAVSMTAGDFPGGSLEFQLPQGDQAGVQFVVAEERGYGLDDEVIVKRIRDGTGSDDAWNDGDSRLELAEGQLLVAAPPERLEAAATVAAALADFRRRYVALDAVVVAAGPGTRDAARDAAALLERARRRDGARVAAQASALGLNTQRFHAWTGSETPIVATREVEIAQASAATDPEVSALRGGLLVDVRPQIELGGRRLRVQLRAEYAGSCAIEAIEPPPAPGGALQRPVVELFRARADAALDAGAWTVLAESTAPAAAGRPAETLFLLVRARILEPR